MEDNYIQAVKELRFGRRFILQQDNDPKLTVNLHRNGLNAVQ